MIILVIMMSLSMFCFGLCFKNEREKLQQQMKTKSGAEPKLVVLVNADDDPVSIFIVADAITLCEVPNADVGSALLASYFMLNLNFPDSYSQVLGLIHQHCLQLHFPENKRKTGFHNISQLM